MDQRARRGAVSAGAGVRDRRRFPAQRRRKDPQARPPRSVRRSRHGSGRAMTGTALPPRFVTTNGVKIPLLSRRRRRRSAARAAARPLGKRTLLLRADGRRAQSPVPRHRPRPAGPRPSDKPATGYSVAEHANDVLGLMDSLGLERAVVGGHSFGAYVGIYLAAKHPDRVTKLIVIDAAITLNPRVGELLRPRSTGSAASRRRSTSTSTKRDRRRTSTASGTTASRSTSAPRFTRTPTGRRSRRPARRRSARRCRDWPASRGAISYDRCANRRCCSTRSARTARRTSHRSWTRTGSARATGCRAFAQGEYARVPGHRISDGVRGRRTRDRLPHPAVRRIGDVSRLVVMVARVILAGGGGGVG